MKKNHKTLYMILAVLLVSFLFFGSREKEVVEGFQEGNDSECDDAWKRVDAAFEKAQTNIKGKIDNAKANTKKKCAKATVNEIDLIVKTIQKDVDQININYDNLIDNS